MKIKFKEKKTSAAAETVKTLLLVLLTVSMLALIVVYIGGTHIYQSMTDTSEKRVFDKLWSVQSGQRASGLDQGRLLPETVAFRRGTTQIGTADLDSTRSLYELVAPCVLELFGTGSHCEELDGTAGRLYYTEAMSGEEFIYVRYHEPVLYQFIYAYASGKLTVSDSDVAAFSPLDSGEDDGGSSGVYISELVIIPESDVAAHRFVAVARDNEGHYYRFRRDPDALASEFHIAKLSDAASKLSTVRMSFPSDSGEVSFLDSLVPFPADELESCDILPTPTETAGGELTDRILRLFGYNPDKTGEAGNGIFYDSHSLIRLESGKISYQSADPNSGVSISELLGYTADDGFGLFDKLAAVDSLLTGLSELSKSLVGGEASLCLGNVYADDGLLVYEYFYTYDNIRISEEPAVRAEFGQDSLCSFEIKAESFSTLETRTLSPRPEYIARKLSESGAIPDGMSGIVMRRIYTDGKAAWKAFLPAGAGNGDNASTYFYAPRNSFFTFGSAK